MPASGCSSSAIYLTEARARKVAPLCDGYVTNPPVYWASASIRTMLFVPFPSMSKLD